MTGTFRNNCGSRTVRIVNGADGLPGPSLPTAYLWNGASGCYFDEDVGMYLMGLRWYESFTGRFLTKDPIGFGGGDPNLYRYVWNNPVNAVDPWGADDTWALGERTFRYLATKGAGLAQEATSMGPATLRYLANEVPAGSVGISNASWGDYTPWLDPASNFFAGASDYMTFGLTDYIREKAGVNIAVDKNSGAYVTGQVSGFVLFTAITLSPQGIVLGSETQVVTRWGPEGGKWVMTGGKTLRNYILSGAVENYQFGSGVTRTVLKSELAFPGGWEWVKGLWGQRILLP